MLKTREYTLCSPFRANAHNSSYICVRDFRVFFSLGRGYYVGKVIFILNQYNEILNILLCKMGLEKIINYDIYNDKNCIHVKKISIKFIESNLCKNIIHIKKDIYIYI